MFVVVSLLKRVVRVGLCKMKEDIKLHLKESYVIINYMFYNEKIIDTIKISSDLIIDALKKGNKVITAGNGGSASDATHFVGELVSRFNFDRPPLNAIALNSNTTVMTAIGNDYGYDKLFSRQIAGLGKKGDIFIAYSTSGESKNILNALSKARELNIKSIAMSGSRQSTMRSLCDIYIEVPSDKTPFIQEGHAVIGHIICELVEKKLFSKY